MFVGKARSLANGGEPEKCFARVCTLPSLMLGDKAISLP
jgi:hypothetical protein